MCTGEVGAARAQGTQSDTGMWRVDRLLLAPGQEKVRMGTSLVLGWSSEPRFQIPEDSSDLGGYSPPPTFSLWPPKLSDPVEAKGSLLSSDPAPQRPLSISRMSGHCLFCPQAARALLRSPGPQKAAARPVQLSHQPWGPCTYLKAPP